MVKKDMTRTLSFYFSGLLSILVAGYIAFGQLGGGVFFSWDSSSYIAFANESIANGMPFHLGPSYNQSLGNMTHPIDFWLLPEAVLSFQNGKIDPRMFYLITAVLFYSCAFIMALVFGLGQWIAIISANIFTLLTLPYSSPVVLTEFYWWHAPFMIPTVYMAFGLLITYYFLGRLRGAWNVVPVMLFSLATIWTIAGYPKLAVTIFLGVAIFCLVFTVAIERKRELLWKIIGVIVAGIAIIFTGPWKFITGVYGYTGQSLFRLEMVEIGGSMNWSALLEGIFHSPNIWIAAIPPNLVWVKYHIGYTLTILALIGAVWALVSPRWPRPTKLLAVGILLLFPYSFISIYASVYPAQVLYILFAFALVPIADSVMAKRWSLASLKIVPNSLKINSDWLGIAIVVIVSLYIGLTMSRVIPGGYPYPGKDTVASEYLKNNIGFSLGSVFRGRYVNMLLTEQLDNGEALPISNTTAYAIAVAGARMAAKEGNDLIFANLRESDIPVTVEYNRMTNPLSTLFHNILLVREGDRDRIDYRTITHFDSELLGLLGVRYVMLKREQPEISGVKIAMEQPVPSRHEVVMYELQNYNTGQYSPTTLQFSENILETFDILSSKSFNPRKQAIIHEKIEVKNLLTANNVEITRVRNGLHIKAKSDGLSFIVLPFEFSHCLVFTSATNMMPKSVTRSDLFLTGVLFDKETEFNMNFTFGPFSNQNCRLKDLSDIKALGINSESIKLLRDKHPSKLIFDGYQ